MPGQVPTRFTEANPQTVSDIYDKLSHLESLFSNLSTPAPTPAPTPTIVTRPAGSTGSIPVTPAPSYAYAIIPILATLPSNNPVQGAPYAVNGVMVEVAGQLYVYQGFPTYAWQAAGTAVQESSITNAEYLTVGGTATAITGTTATPYAALAVGFKVILIPASTNLTGPVTLNVNGIGAQPVTKNGANPLTGQELVSGIAYLLTWDGTEWVILTPLAPSAATVLASSLHGAPIAAPLATAKIWIGSAGALPVAQPFSGDVALTAAGLTTVTQVNGAAVPLSAALVGTNASRQIILASAFASSSFTPTIKVGGATTSITFTFTATSVITGSGTGAPVLVVMNVTITGWPAVPVGTVTIESLPVSALAQVVGNFAAISGFVGLSAGVSIIPILSGTVITLDTQGATGVVALGAATIANGSVFTVVVSYQGA